MNVPLLRFKEFSGESFFITKFGDVIQSNKYGPRFDASDYSPYGNVKTIRGTDVSANGFIKYNDVPLALLDEKTINDHKLNNGDLVVITTADCGVTGVFVEQNIPFVASAYAVKITLTSKGYPYYFKYYFQTKSIKNEINKYIRKATVSNLPMSDIAKFRIGLPTYTEQTKIANFLTSIDEKISQLTQKKELLSQYKQGVMQQIFSQQLRFKDDNGEDFGDWEEKTFGDIFDFMNTNSFSRELLSYTEGTVKNIHYGDIHTKFKSNFNILYESVPYIVPSIDLSKIDQKCYCQKGDLIIADASEDYADIGKTIEIVELNNEILLAGLHTYIARQKNQNMALGFGGYLMQAAYVRKQIKVFATGVSVLGISKTYLAKVKLQIPSKAEQTKIANFLTAIDQKIQHANQQINTAKQYKQGLLQQMFV